jgi:hypothetical protein
LTRVLYYALGGGHGHVLRGLALLRALGEGTLIAPARLAEWACRLDVRVLAPPADGAAAWVAALPVPKLLLVDVFPRGVVGELAPLLGQAPAWLISRWVRPEYYLHPDVRAALEEGYERVLWTEQPEASLRELRVAQTDVEPILLDAAPLTRAEARRALDVPDGQALLLALGSGDGERQALLLRLLAKIAARLGLTLRLVSDVLPPGDPVVRLFPAARWLQAADVLVSAAGYHAFHEARASGVPTVLVPQARRYDDQFRRASAEVVALDPVALERAIHAQLGRERRPWRSLGEGARRAARLVQRRVEQGVLGEEEIAAMA